MNEVSDGSKDHQRKLSDALLLPELDDDEVSLLIYRETAKSNWRNSQLQRAKRREKAWQLVRLATALLKEKFGVNKVMVFGYLIYEDCFTLWSDVDIAAWGILPQDTFKAIGEIRELDQTIEINLADIETCKPELLEKILREGREV